MNVEPWVEFDEEPDTRRLAQEEFFGELDRAEVEIVRRVVDFAARHNLGRVAALCTRLGNGWLYPFLWIFFVLSGTVARPVTFAASSGLSFVLAHSLYPLLKQRLGRTRPCDYDVSLVHSAPALDLYSCPSGHAMTSSAFGVSLLFACPTSMPLVIVICGLIGWSRVATGHHYVTDVVAGTIFGAVISVPVALVLY